MRALKIAASILWPLLTGIPGAVAAQPSSPVLDWVSEGTITLTAEKVSTVQVLNRSNKSLNLRARLIWSEEGGAKKPKELVPKVETDRLQPESVGVISLQPEKEAAGSYTGVLLVNAYDEDKVLAASIRRNVELNIQEDREDGPQLRFLVSEIKLRKYLGLPWGDPSENAVLPLGLRTSVPPAIQPEALPIAFLTEENGDIAWMRLELPPKELVKLVKPDLTLMGLRGKLHGLDNVGTYRGTLTAQDGEDDKQGTENKSVTISVTTAHHPFFALLAITGGLALALWLQRQTGFLRPYRAIRLRVAELGKKALPDAEGFSINKDFQDRLGKLDETMKSLTKSSFASLDESSPTYLRVKTELESLESAVETWAGLPASARRLKQELDSEDWDSVPQPPLRERRDQPALHKAKRALLAGRELTLETLKDLAPQVSEGPAAIELWKALNARARGLEVQSEGLLQFLGSPDETPPLRETWERIETARKDLLKLWNRLWVDATLDFSALNESLEEIEGQLWIEEGLLLEAEALEAASLDRKKLREKVFDFKFLLEAVRPEIEPTGPHAYERLALLLQARSRRAEIFIAFLAFLIAVYTGMNAEYFDEPFGTWRDYADIVVWAVAAGTLSDLLLKALDRLWVLGTAVRRRTTP